MNNLFNHESGFGECTPLCNIMKVVGLENGETYGLDRNKKWHNGYAILTEEGKKFFLSRWELTDDDFSELSMEQVEFETSGNDLDVDFETLKTTEVI